MIIIYWRNDLLFIVSLNISSISINSAILSSVYKCKSRIRSIKLSKIEQTPRSYIKYFCIFFLIIGAHPIQDDDGHHASFYILNNACYTIWFQSKLILPLKFLEWGNTQWCSGVYTLLFIQGSLPVEHGGSYGSPGIKHSSDTCYLSTTVLLLCPHFFDFFYPKLPFL